LCGFFHGYLPIAEGLLVASNPKRHSLWLAFFISVAILHFLTVVVTLLKVIDIQRYYFEFNDIAEELKISKERVASLEEQTASLQHAGVALKNSIDQLQRVPRNYLPRTPLRKNEH